jgi:hypothetical protein
VRKDLLKEGAAIKDDTIRRGKRQEVYKEEGYLYLVERF